MDLPLCHPQVNRPHVYWRTLLSCPNPFYVLSAAVTLFGIRQYVHHPITPSETWVLWSIVVGYTLMLAAVTLFVVRLAREWEDARSLLLLLPVMFLTLSTLADHSLVTQIRSGEIVLLAGCVFTIVCTEAVLFGTKLQIGLGYRLVYYLLMATIFAYPALVAEWSRNSVERTSVNTPLRAFIPMISFELLLLLPAIWRWKPRAGIAVDCPYQFPLYPLALFVVVGLLAAMRAYLLELTFGTGRWNQVALSPADFVPLVAVGCVLLLESGVRVQSETLKQIALWIVPTVLLLGCLGGGLDVWNAPEEARKLGFAEKTLVVLFSIAWLRQVPGARLGIVVSLLVLATLLRSPMENWNTVALMTAGTIQWASGLARQSARALWPGSFCVALAACTIQPVSRVGGPEPVFVLHVLLLATFVIAAFVRESWILRTRYLSLLGLVCLASVLLLKHQGSSEYIVATVIVLLTYGIVVRDLTALAGVGAILIAFVISTQPAIARPRWTDLKSRGLEYFVLGWAFLIAGAIFSASKSPRVRRMVRNWLTDYQRSRKTASTSSSTLERRQ